MITDGVHTENTEGNGGPQADLGGERESSEFRGNLNGCPQADSFGERQLENNKYPQMTRRDTDGGPQADGGLGRIMITGSSDWTDVRIRTMCVNANYLELNVN